MFHLFEKTYLDFDFFYTSSGPETITISPKWHGKVPSAYPTWEVFVQSELAGDETQFWSVAFGKSDRSIFVTPEILLRLQIIYWKNIFSSANIQSVFQLHQMFVEDCKLKAYLMPRLIDPAQQEGYRSVRGLRLSEFQIFWEEAPEVPFLRKLRPESLSFEYQVANLFLNDKSAVKSAVLQKVRHFTWLNWFEELNVLRVDMLNGIMDINRLLPADKQIDDRDPTCLFSEFLGHSYLNWVFDECFVESDYVAVESKYEKEIFKQLYSRFYSLWQVNGEDMAELIDLIYAHQYETLLYRDVKRGFGTAFAAGRFRRKMNHVFLTWIYRCQREGKTALLQPYQLHL